MDISSTVLSQLSEKWIKKQWILNYFAILAIIITFIGMIIAYTGNFLGVEIIVLGYIFEPIAGISIYLTTLGFPKHTPPYSSGVQ